MNIGYNVKHIYFLIYLVTIVVAQQEDCVKEQLLIIKALKSEVRKITRNNNKKLFEDYTDLKDQFTSIKLGIDESSCEQKFKDSLLIVLTQSFATKVSKEVGDFSHFLALLEGNKKKCDMILNKRVFEGDHGTWERTKDWYIDRRGDYRKAKKELDKDYGDLIIAFDVPDLIKEMGEVVDNISKEPVAIHILPPRYMIENEKIQRLEYIKDTFTLDFSEEDDRLGKVKRIKYLPKAQSDGIQTMDQDILDSYAFTFEKVKRYRTKLTDGIFDILYIKPQNNWILLQKIPGHTAIIELDSRLNYDSPLVSEIPREDLFNRSTKTITLTPGIDNVEIRIKNDNFNDKVYTITRMIIISALAFYTII